MKYTEAILISTALGLAHLPLLGQGTFQNLNFEQANPILAYPGQNEPNDVTAASALPGWTVLISGVQQSVIGLNDPSGGAPWVSLFGPGNNYGTSIDGNYSVLLQGTTASAAISQSGLIPPGTQSVMFEARMLPAQPGSLEVLIGTQPVPVVEVATGPNYVEYGANISAWAGQTEQLTFSAQPGAPNFWELDDITFSPTAVVPEPSSLTLTGIGGILFVLYHRFASKRA